MSRSDPPVVGARCINNATRLSVIKRALKAEGRSLSVSLRLDPRMGSAALRRLIGRVSTHPELRDRVLELIPYHSKADDAVFHDLVEFLSSSEGIANSVATSLRAPIEIIRSLTRHPDRYVRDHARRNLAFKDGRETVELAGARKTENLAFLQPRGGRAPKKPREGIR